MAAPFTDLAQGPLLSDINPGNPDHQRDRLRQPAKDVEFTEPELYDSPSSSGVEVALG
ncbi:hypothetical protein [Micromonospora sp. WMMD1082]|uniref:hypothetical protein n=1 Tax=Micromonospora sp. WMMD1082 TaxID=3016104 RepID=UPI002417B3BC|nr:hypothetical protein [Micromonospora sp. WMMD1082]MDG4797545.1 hypothetical protein [Micromonospora sp. WMMD1082]